MNPNVFEDILRAHVTNLKTLRATAQGAHAYAKSIRAGDFQVLGVPPWAPVFYKCDSALQSLEDAFEHLMTAMRNCSHSASISTELLLTASALDNVAFCVAGIATRTASELSQNDEAVRRCTREAST